MSRRTAIGLAFVAGGLAGCKDQQAQSAAALPSDPPADTRDSKASDGGAASGDAKASGDGGTPRRKGLFDATREVITSARRASDDPIRLIPASASFVVQVDPAPLLADPGVSALWAKAEASDEDFRTAVKVLRACVGPLPTIDTILLAIDSDEHAALVMRAPRLGTEDTWRCFDREAKAQGEPMDITLTGTSPGDGPQLRDDDGDPGYFADEDTLVLTSKEWSAEIQARLEGKGTSALEGPLAPTARRIELDSPLWAVGRLEGKARSSLVGTPMAGIEDVAFSLKFEGTDLQLALSSDAGAEEDATRVRDEIDRQFAEFKGFLPMLGFPSSLLAKVAFVAEGDLVSLELRMTASELDELRRGIEKNLP